MSAEKSKEAKIGIILLAAGGSSRLGRPKQLLRYKDETLLQHTLREALSSHAELVVIVLGAGADVLQKEINADRAHVVINNEWQEGMASSIRAGVEEISKVYPSIKGLILLVCDQPYIQAGLLNQLITAHQKTSKRIVACSYGNTYGPPVLFHQSLFPELLQLEGDTGARRIVQQHIDDVEVIPFSKGIVDIDTQADYEKIKTEENE